MQSPTEASPAIARRRLSQDERREQLIAATVEILAERGYARATSDEIALRAGVSKGLLWHYFDDLDQLYETTALRTLTALMEATGASIDLAAPVPELIRSAIHAAAALRVTHDSARRAIREVILNLRTPDGELRFSQVDLGTLYAAQEQIFRRGQAEGDIDDSLDPRLLAVTYQGAVDSMLGYLDAFPDSDARHHADTVADILLGGIQRRVR